MIAFEIIKKLDKIREYYPQLDQLFNSGEYEASLSTDWTEALRRSHLGNSRYFLLVLKNSAEILGIVPLCIREAKKSGLSLLKMTPIAEYFGTHSDILLKNPSRELVGVLLKALFTMEFKWDVFRINRFVETNPILEHITHNLKKNLSFKYDIRRAEPSFYIPLPNSYSEFLSKKSSNFRYQLKRTGKKINALGTIRFLKSKDFRNFDEAFNTIVSIEENSWKHKHGTSIVSSQRQREFYKHLYSMAFDRGWFRLCVLYLNDVPIAFESGLVKSKKYFGVHGSYIEKYKNQNPGTWLLARFIEDLIQDGIQEYDWFGEPFEWQTRWTDQYRRHKSLLIYNRTPKAFLFHIYNRLKNRNATKIGDKIVFCNPRDVKPQEPY